MRLIAITILVLLAITSVRGSQGVSACYCIGDLVENEFVKAANIFIGEVVDVSGPREVATGSGVEKFNVIRFFVWDRWKGAKTFDVEVLSELPENSCVAYPPMRVGEIYVVFAQPFTVKNGSQNLQGLVTTCTLTTRMVGPGPQHEVHVNALATIFALDKLTKPATPQRTPAFGRQPIGKILF
jgi:hypothetical protein